MSELLATLGSLIASLANVRSAAVAREHVALLQSKLTLFKDEFSNLEEENAALKERVRELEQQLAGALVAEQFADERGAFFKRRPGGGYHDAVYCPFCHVSTSPFPPGEQFHCRCGWSSSFTEEELPSVIASLPP